MKKIRLFIAVVKAIADYVEDKKSLKFYKDYPDLYKSLKEKVILKNYLNENYIELCLTNK